MCVVMCIMAYSQASYPELDHTPADNAAGVPVNTCTAAVCHVCNIYTHTHHKFINVKVV